MLSLVTSTLGALKNYVKYKQVKFLLFTRTPVICVILATICKLINPCVEKFDLTNAFFVIVLERWIMLIYKSVTAYFSKNYLSKKDKYIKKYGLKYAQ